jgi:hypothetical protein
MNQVPQHEIFVGRETELRLLREAVCRRQSLLIWGPADAGKTALTKRFLGDLCEEERRLYVYLTGARRLQELLRQMMQQLYEVGDAHLREKVHADGASEKTLDRWLREQSSLRLRGIVFRAAEQGHYSVFLDHLPPPSHALARWIKEMVWRCKTPVYLVARGFSQQEIGYAWSLYWTDRYRISVGPLSQAAAHALLEICIRRFGLSSLELEDFCEETLELSGYLPGAIVKMCALAAQPGYQHGRHIKNKLVHIDYLMHFSGRTRAGF